MKGSPMPRYMVELAFEIRFSYFMDTDSPEAALDCAIAKHDSLPKAERPPMEFAKGLLDARVFDAAGNELDVEN